LATAGDVRSLTVIPPSGSFSDNWEQGIDGRINIHEAAYWYRHGNEGPQSVPLNSVDLQGIRASEFSTIGDIESFRLDFRFEMHSGFSAATIFRNIETFLAGLAIGAGQPFVIDLTGTARIE